MDVRLRALVFGVIVFGTAVVMAPFPTVVRGPLPDLWRLALGASLFYLGERAMFHLRFGRDQQSFNWLETSLVIGLIVVPSPWLRLVAGVGAAGVHVWRRRPPLKIAFNGLSCVVGVHLGRVAMLAITPEPSDALKPRTWLGLAVASFVFFVWNGLTVSLAVAFSQGIRFRDVHMRGFLLNLLVWLGNTALGVMIVAMAAAQLALLMLLPVLFILLVLAYRSYVQAIHERDTWQVLQAASRELLQVDEDELVEVVLDRSASLFDADLVEILLVDGETGLSGRVATHDPNGPTHWRVGPPLDIAPAVWGRALSDREPFELTRKSTSVAQEQLVREGIALAAVGPLLIQGRCVGALRLGFRSPSSFSERHRRVFATFANNVSSAIHNARLFQDSRHAALHDPLTGLPNRVLLLDRLEQALERSRRHNHLVAVLFLDLDRFKVVNDSLGHDVGDRLLVAAAQRMTSVLRPGDTATRFGGDEFVVVCEDIEGENDATEIAQRLADALLEPFSLGEHEAFVTVSVGVAISQDADDQASSLIRDADAAMYRAKERGRARAEVFDRGMRAEAIARLETENDLRRAIERDELRVFYQPAVDVATGAMVGCEALVRWDHPDKGLVSPASFIPLAEETGLIGRLTEWVLEEACRQLAEWNDTLSLPSEFCVAINLSAREVAEPGLVETIAGVLARHDIDPPQLSLEITETALLQDIDAALGALARLRRLGVTVALDDFGTGYSSLSYLRRLPVDVLKIDRSFVARLGDDGKDRAVVAGMIDLAHALNLTVIAEGVETAAQLHELRVLGCDAAQGWLLARPQPGPSIALLLEEQRSIVAA